RAADPAGFQSFFNTLQNAEVVHLVGPRGTTVPLKVTVDPSSNNSVFTLTFAPQVADGTYTLVIQPNTLGLDVRDLAGNAQDRNLTNGEIPFDGFGGLLAVNSSDDGRFITGLYHDLLARQADTAGFLMFLGGVDGARNQGLASLAAAFANSAENYGNFIRR